MKKSIKKATALILSTGLTLSALIGCSSSSLSVKDNKYEITDNSEVIFDLGKSTITYGEMMYFVAYFEMLGEYQKAYYQSAMGYNGDFWNEVDENGNPESSNYKNSAFQEAHYVEVMKNAAIDAGITLTDEELADIEKSAKESFDIYTDEQKKNAGITYEGFYSAQKTMAYSTKYISQLKDEYMKSEKYKQAIEVVKREDYLAYDVNYAYISLSDSDKNSVDVLAKKTALINDIHDKASADMEFTDIQALYKDNSDVVFSSKVIKRQDDTMDKDILDKLGTLKNEELSDVITTDYGMFVFQMIDCESEEKYKEALSENGDKIIESLVTAKYSELNAEYKVEANEKLTSSIQMGKMTVISK